jgi:hypothetical protein
LTFDSQARPVVAFSVHDDLTDTDSTAVLRWGSSDWRALGEGLAGAGPYVQSPCK